MKKTRLLLTMQKQKKTSNENKVQLGTDAQPKRPGMLTRTQMGVVLPDGTEHTSGGTATLNVPLPMTQGVETQSLCDLVHSHCVG
jgi:hypothetical protein